MSLDPRDSHRRGRSKSPGRERERSRSRVDERERSRTRVIERAPSPPTTRYDDRDSRYDYEEETIRKSSRRADVVQADPRDYRDPRDSRDKLADPRDPRYVSSSSKYRSSSPMPGSYVEEEDVRVKYSGGREKDYYAEKSSKYGKKDKYQRDDSPPSRYTEADVYKYEVESRGRDKERERERELEIAQRERERIYEEEKQKRERGSSFHLSGGVNTSYLHGGIDINHRSPSPSRGRYSPPSKKPDPLAYGDAPPDIAGRSYADPKQWQYAAPQETITYSSRSEREKVYPRPEATHQQSYESGSHSRHNSYVGDSARSSKSQIVTVEPGSRHRRDSSPPGGLAPRMHSLSVSTAHHGGASLSLANAPGSPLLESYHGTYQSISPMPSPLMIAHSSDLQVVESISPLSSDDERGGRGKKKRSARFHDPEEEAMALAKALKGEKRAPDTEPLIEILPSLTHDQVLDLRVEYKRIVKTGSEKKGVNIAKHIKMRLKEEDPSLMKACYVCALGKWESEAYWANFWYQGEKSRRELLIESLMGRTNREIREIKDGFSDKKYSDSLTKCMKTELKEDKFKKAVLLVLEEKRMDERPGLPVDRRLVEEDVRDLHKAVKSEKGGESAMINIVVVRGDNHLREILRLYESTYRANFAREMLKKSGNLVGELLAHILNGVINKPVRDALLLHHALSLSKSDSIRTELLISRLVRYHWDRPHFEAVKKEYRNRYGTDLQRAVAEGTRGEWGRFCEQLCLRRQGDEVKRIL